MRFSWAIFRRFSVVWLIAVGTWALLHSQLGTSCPHGLAPEPHMYVDAAMFGVEMPADDEGTTFFVETSRVPLVVGATFGWRMHLVNAPEELAVREELVLPAAPETWRHDGNTEISGDRTTAATEMLVQPTDGWFSNSWSFTEGDPEGIYSMRIYVGEALVKEFRFRVESVDTAAPRVGKGCGGH